MTNLLPLLERAPFTLAKQADYVVGFILNADAIEEMRNKRGSDYNTTNFYQIRVKPKVKDEPLENILTRIEKYLKGSAGKKFGISEVQINQRSRNSGKYSSVSFNYIDGDWDVVVAQGGNKGENFEKDLLLKMDNLVAGIGTSDEAKKAFGALEELDSDFKLNNISSVAARSGSTQRSGDMSPEETGKIIADIIITLKKGGERYISVKNSSGSTVAQFGLSKAFTDDLKVNVNSPEWKQWLAPFNIEPKKVESGLLAARDGTDLAWDDIDKTVSKVKKGSPIHKIMQKMWGAGYYYLREVKGGFKALKIDRDYVDNTLLKNLAITEIRYPSKARKQINVYLESESMKFKLEVRNPRGKGSIKPTQIQLTIMKGAK